nr:MAG TPA: hypothetical protein [Caudoviricetes sp.]
MLPQFSHFHVLPKSLHQRYRIDLSLLLFILL